MPILTENKIKKLLKTTDLKVSKSLILEKGTIITPSAKGYLHGISIQYKSSEVNHDTPIVCASNSENVLEMKIGNYMNTKSINGYTNNWRSYCECLISDVLSSQLLCLKYQKNELITKLEVLTIILKEFHQMNFQNESWDKYKKSNNNFEIEKNVKPLIDPEIFIPTYSDGEIVIALYQLYSHIHRLEANASFCLQNYVLIDDYNSMSENCLWMANYVWELMIQESTKKSRRKV